MLHAGQTVDVIVRSVQAYGLHCTHNDIDEVLVLIPETSWTASYCSCEQFANVGDRITVKILRIDDGSGKIAASIRQRYPDPWATEAFRVGRRYTARFVRRVHSADRCSDTPGHLLELVPGSFVMLCTPFLNLAPGDTCDVTITGVNSKTRAVSVSISNDGDGKPDDAHD